MVHTMNLSKLSVAAQHEHDFEYEHSIYSSCRDENHGETFSEENSPIEQATPKTDAK